MVRTALYEAFRDCGRKSIRRRAPLDPASPLVRSGAHPFLIAPKSREARGFAVRKKPNFLSARGADDVLSFRIAAGLRSGDASPFSKPSSGICLGATLRSAKCSCNSIAVAGTYVWRKSFYPRRGRATRLRPIDKPNAAIERAASARTHSSRLDAVWWKFRARPRHLHSRWRAPAHSHTAAVAPFQRA